MSNVLPSPGHQPTIPDGGVQGGLTVMNGIGAQDGIRTIAHEHIVNACIGILNIIKN